MASDSSPTAWNAGRRFYDAGKESWNGRRSRGDDGMEWRGGNSTVVRPAAAVKADQRVRRRAGSTSWWTTSPALSVKCHLREGGLLDSHG